MVKLFALVCLLPSLVFAAGPLPVIDRPVVDPAERLSARETEEVARSLVELRGRTGTQMAVLVVDTTSGEPIEDYAMRVARQWRGGQSGANNGLLFVLALKDRRMRLEVGYGLEEFLPDDAVRRLLDAQHPLMRQGNVSGAILQIIKGVGARLTDGGLAGSADVSGARSIFHADLVQAETLLLGALLFVLCALVLRPGWRERMGREWGVLLCAVLLLAPMLFVGYRAWEHEALMLRLVGVLLVFGGLFFLGWHVAVNSQWLWEGACLMVGTLAGLYASLRSPWGPTFLSVLIFSLVCTFAVLFISSTMVGKLFMLPWMWLMGGREAFDRWGLARTGRSYAAGGGSDSEDPPTWSVWELLSSPSPHTSSSSSSSWDSSSSSSSSDSSSSSSSSSDWGGGGGDFGGGGSSSSW